MGELWIIEPNGNLISKTVNHEKNERHAKALKEYIIDNQLNVELDDAIYNLGITMAKIGYCIIDIDSENIVLFLPFLITKEQKNTIKKHLHFLKNYPILYVDVADEINTYSHDKALTKIYKKIKEK